MIKKHVCFIFLLTCFLCFTASIYAQQKFVANLSGSQQVPANTSGSRGLCKLSLIQNETQIELACNYSNLSSASTAVHIHGGASVGADAPILIAFPSPGAGSTSGGFAAAFNFPPQFLTNLRTNRLYVDIHTANFPSLAAKTVSGRGIFGAARTINFTASGGA